MYKSLLCVISVAALVVAGSAQAAFDTACSVSVTATHNGDVVETYGRDFTLARDVPFFDDFSTATRQEEFRASVTREADGVKVHISYFSDLGTFHAASFDADLQDAHGLLFQELNHPAANWFVGTDEVLV